MSKQVFRVTSLGHSVFRSKHGLCWNHARLCSIMRATAILVWLAIFVFRISFLGWESSSAFCIATLCYSVWLVMVAISHFLIERGSGSNVWDGFVRVLWFLEEFLVLRIWFKHRFDGWNWWENIQKILRDPWAFNCNFFVICILYQSFNILLIEEELSVIFKVWYSEKSVQDNVT